MPYVTIKPLGPDEGVPMGTMSGDVCALRDAVDALKAHGAPADRFISAADLLPLLDGIVAVLERMDARLMR